MRKDGLERPWAGIFCEWDFLKGGNGKVSKKMGKSLIFPYLVFVFSQVIFHTDSIPWDENHHEFHHRLGDIFL